MGFLAGGFERDDVCRLAMPGLVLVVAVAGIVAASGAYFFAPRLLTYTVLVHVYDSNGALLANGDTPPLHGGFPTSL